MPGSVIELEPQTVPPLTDHRKYSRGSDLLGRAVAALRTHGIGAINLDLVYGLPLQTVRSCVDTVEQALELKPVCLAARQQLLDRRIRARIRGGAQRT